MAVKITTVSVMLVKRHSHNKTRRRQHSQGCKYSHLWCFCDPWSFDCKQMGSQDSSWVHHFYIQFGDPRCTGFEKSCR